MYFYYRAYGLKIKSEIMINEFLKTSNKDYDVLIDYGYMPQEVVRRMGAGEDSYYSKDKIWFSIKDVATYYISNGNTIVVKTERNVDYKMLKYHVMYTCIGFIMLQRRQLVINGGASIIGGTGVILISSETIGKATLTKTLAMNGYPFVSDDISVMDINNSLIIKQGFPYQKVCEEDMKSMGYSKDDYNYIKDEDGQAKYMIDAFDNFFDEEVKLGFIFNLKVGDIPELVLESVKGKAKLDTIFKHIYKEEFIQYFEDFYEEYQNKVSCVSSGIKFYNLIIPRSKIGDGISFNDEVELIRKIVVNDRYYASDDEANRWSYGF